ncbi:hypothetical protein [Paracandidimonas soli]|uniref:hypothetical protein n=1 Tax=Paracandidimonas soli TaxID=1917182 RepID=UPI00333F9F61
MQGRGERKGGGWQALVQEEHLAAEGLIVAPSESTEAFDQFVGQEVSLWKQLVEDSGATVN